MFYKIENDLVITRSISTSGKNVIKINNQNVTVNQLKQIGHLQNVQEQNLK